LIALVLLAGVPENAILGANRLSRRGRAPKNIGGRIAPAAIAGLIEALLCSVNAFRALPGQTIGRRKEVKVLTRLNFLRSPFKPALAEGN
jgi:hypothetical protein